MLGSIYVHLLHPVWVGYSILLSVNTDTTVIYCFHTMCGKMCTDVTRITSAHTYTHTYTHTHMHAHTRTHACTHTNTHTHTLTHTHTRTYAHTHTHTHKHPYTYTHAHTHRHIDTHTESARGRTKTINHRRVQTPFAFIPPLHNRALYYMARRVGHTCYAFLWYVTLPLIPDLSYIY